MTGAVQIEPAAADPLAETALGAEWGRRSHNTRLIVGRLLPNARNFSMCEQDQIEIAIETTPGTL